MIPIDTDLATTPHKMKISRVCWSQFLYSLSLAVNDSAVAEATSRVVVDYTPLQDFDVARFTFHIGDQQHESYTAFIRQDIPRDEIDALTHKIVFQTVAYYQWMNAVLEEPQDE